MQVGNEAEEVVNHIDVEHVLREDLVYEESLNIFEQARIEVGADLKEDWDYCRRGELKQVSTGCDGEFEQRI